MVFRLGGKVGRIREALFKLMGAITESFRGQYQIIPVFSAHFMAVLQRCLAFGAQKTFF